MAMGLPAGLLGLALRAWAAGCLAKNQQLATGGPYAHTRNPLYIGTLLVAAGLSMASRSLFLALLFAAVFLLIYLPVIQNEEQHLRKIFPDYAGYAERVPALWPRLKPAVKESSNPFRVSQYLKNEEYKAGLGFTAGMLFLLWKMKTKIHRGAAEKMRNTRRTSKSKTQGEEVSHRLKPLTTILNAFSAFFSACSASPR